MSTPTAAGRTGWYYRVLEPGTVAVGDRWTLVERPHSDFPLPSLQNALYVKMLDYDELQAIADLPVLADGWWNLAQKRLATKAIESWSARFAR